MPEENNTSKKDKDKTTHRASWKPDETQIIHFQEGLTPKSSERTKEKEKTNDEKHSE